MYTLQGAPSFIPASGSCHTSAKKETEVHQFTIAKHISEQIILPRGRYYVSQNQLTAIESWLMRLSGGHHIAWMDFKQWCGTIPFRKVPIQMKIKSLNCSSCRWIFAFSPIACHENVCCICFKDKILLRMMFFPSQRTSIKRCFTLLPLEDCQLSVFHFLLLSIGVNKFDFHRQLFVDFEYRHLKDILHTHTHSSLYTHEHTLEKLISRATLLCRTYPTSCWVDVFTPTLSRLRVVCLLAWHSSDLLPPGTLSCLLWKTNSASYLAVSAPSPHAECGYCQACNIAS